MTDKEFYFALIYYHALRKTESYFPPLVIAISAVEQQISDFT
jgi:hypothetical protein